MIKETKHKVFFKSADDLSEIEDNSVSLVITSPPYPIIEMWDESFSEQNGDIEKHLEDGNANQAFEIMHQVLDKVWKECQRVLCDGGYACINIGDATRSFNKKFQLYPNHSRIISSFINLGFSNLPNIIWRKQTNAPNKFMGSGMLPPGAYVTLEHEFILVFRNGNKREFKSKEKPNRRESAYFWEERNQWFSDLWELKGTTQVLTEKGARDRSGAYPFEIPYRLINMFSVKGDRILDPFLGTGTTSLAAMASGRNSVGYEIEEKLSSTIKDMLSSTSNLDMINNLIRRRILDHKEFVEKRLEAKGQGSLKYENEWFGFPVMTRQEKKLVLQFLKSISEPANHDYTATYIQEAIEDFQGHETLFSPV